MNKKLIATAVASALMLSACMDDGKNGVDGAVGAQGPQGEQGVDGQDGAVYSSLIQFQGINVAVTDDEKNAIRSSNVITVAGKDQNIAYHTLWKTGDENNGEVFGALKDYQDNVIFDTGSAAPALCNGTQLPSRNGNPSGSGLDHVSILQANGKLYQVAQFECQIGTMYMNELAQDTTTGELSVVDGSLKFVSQKDGFGGYVHCAGMTTPWQTHLGSEEYEPNAASVDLATGSIDSYYDAISEYWGGDLTKANPYYYGWIPEVAIDAEGNPVYAKHYSMGRAAHEMAYVMPDAKTVYMSDDGTNGALYMFVADKAEDLSAGNLYAMKWNQVSGEGAGQATLTWVDMGHSSDAEIEVLLNADGDVTTNDGINFADIFTTDTVLDEITGTCSTVGFTFINTAMGRECLMLKDINGDAIVDAKDEALASRLEKRRMAAYMGATTEFSKMEGITFNADTNKMYMAMSRIYRGMTSATDGKDDKYDFGGNDDVQLVENKCGAVYEMPVASNETNGSDYVAYSMKGVLTGQKVDYTGTSLVGNTCDVDRISEPDNVAFMEGTDILLIGEDTGNHLNDMVWAYDTVNQNLTRIVTTQYGSETTNPYFYKDINGFGYITLTSQHPFGELLGGDAPYYTNAAGTPTDEESLKTQTGYVGPIDMSLTR
jgi:secreted PhoX family phosphatase